MILAKKYKAIISSLSTAWLVLFIGLSTSHMGNKHHLFTPIGDVDQNISNQSEQVSHAHCPWTNAATMTTGSPVLNNSFSDIVFENLYVSDAKGQYLPNLSSIHNPRGPPMS